MRVGIDGVVQASQPIRHLGHQYRFEAPVCPRSSDPFYVVTYYIKWLTTSWTYRFNIHVKYAKEWRKIMKSQAKYTSFKISGKFFVILKENFVGLD